MKACKFYLSGECRYKNCKFYHPPPDEIEKYKAEEYGAGYRGNDRKEYRQDRIDYRQDRGDRADGYGNGHRSSRAEYRQGGYNEDYRSDKRTEYGGGDRLNYRQDSRTGYKKEYHYDRRDDNRVARREYTHQPSTNRSAHSKPFKKRSSLYDPPRWIFSSYPSTTNLISASPDELRYRYMQLTPQEYLNEYREAFMHNYEVLGVLMGDLGDVESTSKRWVDLRKCVDVFDGSEIVFGTGEGDIRGRSGTHADTNTYSEPAGKHGMSGADRCNTTSNYGTAPYSSAGGYGVHSSTVHTPFPTDAPAPTVFGPPLHNEQRARDAANEGARTPKYAFGNIPYL